MALRITGSADEPELLFLPWQVPLEEWPADQLVALPRGISRHVVRFVRVNGVVYAVKEVAEPLAEHEYGLLRRLDRLAVPCVEAVGVVTDRTDPEGEDLEAALITRHLQFSLPYRALFSQTLRPDTANRLLDALALLLVRLHVAGFAWRDCSLSNTLFRRDAGAFAAYLVDAETGELRERLSDGQRQQDIEVAHLNIFGELLDLEAGEQLHESIDPAETAEAIVVRYGRLWEELSSAVVVRSGERYRVDEKVRRLNELGFDVEEFEVTRETDGSLVRVQPKVVEAGHHSRRLLRLTGLDVEENQARRLLNDLDAYRASMGFSDADQEIAAHRWLTDVFEPVVRQVPRELRGKLEPAQVFHEVLEHRWFLSEREGRDVGTLAAARAYVADVLSKKPDELAVLGKRSGSPSDTTMSLPPILD
ncbi:MAG TPA: DUF4032 domain-containing protein [Actinomycetes bacterium]|nr:DUF4032 domain-containing protein [Actinomycetes bacterium]